MKIHELIQGTPDWLAYRLDHNNASEAAAMLGLSKTTTRTELMHAKHTGIGKEFSDWVQLNVLDYGHEVEAMVRPLVESLIGEDLYPVTCSDGRLSASVDGLTMSEEITFECKQWNAEIAAQVAAGVMPEQHMPQGQQILMVTGAKKLIFAVGDGTPENLLTLDVYPDAAWFERIRAGWAQFAKDLAAYVPAQTVARAVGRTPETLPALHIEVTGMVTASNLAEYKAHALAVFGNINRELVTDQDFASAESTVKWCSDIEQRLAAAKQHALSQTESIDALFRTIDDISAEARATRLELDKLVKTRKDSIRAEIVSDARNALADHLDALNTRIGRHLMPVVPVDFAGAIKGKRTLDSMRDAVATELARAKIEANAVADRITLNLRAISEQEGFGFLFYDQAALSLKDPEFVAMAIKNRIDEHQAAETAKEEATRERIRAEEQERADKEAREKLAAEQSEIGRIERKRRSDADALAAQHPQTDAPAEVAQPTTAPTLTHTQVVQQMPAAVRQAMAPAAKPQTPPTMTLGELSTKLGFNVTSVFLASLGFEATTVKAAKLFHSEDFPAICRALIEHIESVCEMQAA